MTTETVYCTNHPQTETLLRCNRCAQPYCVKCLVRTPVGLTCRACLNIQQTGYYTATPRDYTIAMIVGGSAAILAGAIAAALSGFWIIAIFYAPFAGGIISSFIQRAIQKRRGRYVKFAACLAVFFGSALGAAIFPLVRSIASALAFPLEAMPFVLPLIALGSFFSLGFLIYIALVIVTVYARLRS